MFHILFLYFFLLSFNFLSVCTNKIFSDRFCKFQLFRCFLFQTFQFCSFTAVMLF